MSIAQVAKLVGTSNTTVSRVINSRSGVSAETALAVQEAMKQIGFVPSDRRPGPKPNSKRATSRKRQIAVVVSGTASQGTVSSGFNLLLQGIESALAEANLQCNMVFADDATSLPRSLQGNMPAGVLLTGELPTGEAEAAYRKIPVVWLMANRNRPLWGDHVMPDSDAIGRIAARYLLDHGHRHMAFLNVGHAAWVYDVRAAAFQAACREAGATVDIINAPDACYQPSIMSGDERSGEQTVLDQFLTLSPRPTGLFVGDDFQAFWLHTLLSNAGIAPGKDVELIGCNHETPYLKTLQPRPTSIDIRFKLIGQVGVERLLWRMESPDFPGRIVTHIDPILVDHETGSTANELLLG